MSETSLPSTAQAAAAVPPSIAETRSIIRSKMLLAADALERARDAVGPFDGVSSALAYSHDQLFKVERWIAQARYLLTELINADNADVAPAPDQRTCVHNWLCEFCDLCGAVKGGA